MPFGWAIRWFIPALQFARRGPKRPDKKLHPQVHLFAGPTGPHKHCRPFQGPGGQPLFMRASRWFNHHFYFTFGGRSAKCSAKNTRFAAVGCLLGQFLKKRGPRQKFGCVEKIHVGSWATRWFNHRGNGTPKKSLIACEFSALPTLEVSWLLGTLWGDC